MGASILTINAVSAFFLALCWIFVPLRCYVRIFMQRYFGADDALAIASLATFTALCGFVFYGTEVGIGRSIFKLKVEEIAESLKAFFVFELLYVIATCLVKLSFSITLFRIARASSQIYTIWAIMIITIIFTVFYLIWILLTCRPVDFLWTQFQGAKGGHCRLPRYMIPATYAHGAVMIADDLILAILPIILVANLQLTKQTKISIAVLLALGSIASVATIARMPYVQGLNRIDFLSANNDLLVWSMVEVGISITATAMTTLRPLLSHIKGFATIYASVTGRKSKTAQSSAVGAASAEAPPRTRTGADSRPSVSIAGDSQRMGSCTQILPNAKGVGKNSLDLES